MDGLSPAAKLARQHTLRSKAREEEEDKKRKASAQNGSGVNGWDRNTGTRTAGTTRVNDDGTRVLVEDDDDDEFSEGQSAGTWDENSWEDGRYSDEEDEDDTVRIQANRDPSDESDVHPWGGTYRRSQDRDRQPGRSILKRMFVFSDLFTDAHCYRPTWGGLCFICLHRDSVRAAPPIKQLHSGYH